MEIFRWVKKGKEGYILRQHYAIIAPLSNFFLFIKILTFKWVWNGFRHLCNRFQTLCDFSCLSDIFLLKILQFSMKRKKTSHCSADNMKLFLSMRRPFLMPLFQMVIMGCSGASLIAIWNNGMQNCHRIGIKRSKAGNSLYIFSRPLVR